MRVCAAILLAWYSIAMGWGQELPTPQAPTVRTQSNVVLVPALVKNAKGELVFTLKAEDFEVTDDGIPQKLTLDEDTGSEPLALVIAVEAGGTGRDKLDNYHNLGSVIEALVGDVPHRIAVVDFDSTPELARDFTTDADEVGGVLSNLEPGDKGAAILDGLKFSVDLLRKQPAGYRRAILLISETLDHGSQTKMDDVLRAISDTNTAIYTLAFSSGKAAAANYAYHELPVHKTPDGAELGDNMHPGPPHGCMGKDPDPEATKNKAVQAFDCLGLLAPPLALAKMAAIRIMDDMKQNVAATVADLTGGEYMKFEKGKDLTRDLLEIADHLPNRYVLSFQPTAPHVGFHAVELKLKDRPGLRLTARSGYWVDDGRD